MDKQNKRLDTGIDQELAIYLMCGPGPALALADNFELRGRVYIAKAIRQAVKDLGSLSACRHCADCAKPIKHAPIDSYPGIELVCQACQPKPLHPAQEDRYCPPAPKVAA